MKRLSVQSSRISALGTDCSVCSQPVHKCHQYLIAPPEALSKSNYCVFGISAQKARQIKCTVCSLLERYDLLSNKEQGDIKIRVVS